MISSEKENSLDVFSKILSDPKSYDGLMNGKDKIELRRNYWVNLVSGQIVSEPGMGKTKVLINEIKNLITSEVKQIWGEDGMQEKGFDIENHYSFIDCSGMPTEQLTIPYIDKENSDSLLWNLHPELKNLVHFLNNPENDGLTYVVIVDKLESLNKNNQKEMVNLIQSGLLPNGSKIDTDRVWFVSLYTV